MAVLHQCIRPLIGASLCSGPSWISARMRPHYRTGLNGPFGSPVFACAGKTDPPSRLILSQTSAGKVSSYVIAVPDLALEIRRVRRSLVDPRLEGASLVENAQAMRASLLASAIASTLRCRRCLAASIHDLSP